MHFILFFSHTTCICREFNLTFRELFSFVKIIGKRVIRHLFARKLVMFGNRNEDDEACEKKLGKEPPRPEEGGSILISENIAERLKTGIVKDDRLENYDKYWIDKLACIDESHTVRNNLDIDEAEETLKRLTKYAQSAKPKIMFEEQQQLEDCFESSRGNTLECSENVEDFIKQVDRLLYEAVRKNSDEPPSEKKMTYAEKFKRGYWF